MMLEINPNIVVVVVLWGIITIGTVVTLYRCWNYLEGDTRVRHIALLIPLVTFGGFIGIIYIIIHLVKALKETTSKGW